MAKQIVLAFLILCGVFFLKKRSLFYVCRRKLRQFDSASRHHVVPQLIVLDFDGTLIRGDVASLNLRELNQAELRNTFIDSSLLKLLCLVSVDYGHSLRIASHAEHDDIASHRMIQMLDTVLPVRRTFLKEPGHFACWRSGHGKNSHVERLLENAEASGEGTRVAYQVVLIDDNKYNIECARQSGYNAFHCPKGLSMEWFQDTGLLRRLIGFI